MINYGDNNNGIVVLEIQRDSYGPITGGEIAFFRGDEDLKNKADPRMISLVDWIGQYQHDDEEHAAANIGFFKSLLDRFDIKEVRRVA